MHTLKRNSRLRDAIEKLRLHDHVSAIFEKPQEKVDIVVPFIRSGLRRGEKCLHLAPHEGAVHELMDALHKAGIDAAAARKRGGLTVYLPEEIYGEKKTFSPDNFLQFLDKELSAAREMDFTALRFSDEKSWFLQQSSPPELLFESESRLNEFARSRDVMILSLYDIGSFSSETVRNVIRTHPMIIFGGVLLDNYLYLPPEEYFSRDQRAADVHHILQGMQSMELLIEDLQAQRALLKAAFENNPDAVFIKDLDGRYLTINSAGAAYLVKKVEEVVGRKNSELLPPEDAERLAELECKAALCDKTSTSEVSFSVEGVLRTFLASLGGYCDETGHLRGTFGIARDITERKEAEQKIAEYQRRISLMASELSRAEEEERRKLAVALHDHIGQILAVCKLMLEAKASEVGATLDVSQLVRLLDSAIQQTRSLTSELSPPLLYELGLEVAVKALCEEFQKRHGLIVDFEGGEAPIPLLDELRVILYYAIRELLVNVVKHAQAKEARVSIACAGGIVRVTVEDDGIGFEPAVGSVPSDGGFGLMSLRERLKLKGGSLEVDSAPGSGTRAVLTVPLDGDEEGRSR